MFERYLILWHVPSSFVMHAYSVEHFCCRVFSVSEVHSSRSIRSFTIQAVICPLGDLISISETAYIG
jgi:hypothetical protein